MDDAVRSSLQLLGPLIGGIGGTIVFLIPGLVMAKAFARGVRSPELTGQAFVASTAIGGLVTHAIALAWTIPLAASVWAQFSVNGPAADPRTYLVICAWVFSVLIVLPATLGALWARLTDIRHPKFAGVLEFYGISTLKRTAEAWIWAFGELERSRECPRLRVRLKNGRAYLARFGSKSLASSDANLRDLLLESWRELNEQDVPQGESNATGLWIPGDQITVLEFLEEEESNAVTEAKRSH